MPRARRAEAGILADPNLDPLPVPELLRHNAPDYRKRRACAGCHITQPIQQLIRGFGAAGAFCATCWEELVTTFAPRQAGGETLDRYYQQRYGITLAEYGQRFLTQQGACAICRKRPTADHPLAVDHDHVTSAVRGLLCRGCNTGLGCFADNVANMGRAIVYLMEST
jgi:hypothetical protein